MTSSEAVGAPVRERRRITPLRRPESRRRTSPKGGGAPQIDGVEERTRPLPGASSGGRPNGGDVPTPFRARSENAVPPIAQESQPRYKLGMTAERPIQRGGVAHPRVRTQLCVRARPPGPPRALHVLDGHALERAVEVDVVGQDMVRDASDLLGDERLSDRLALGA